MLKKALLTSAAVAAVATSSVATAEVTGNFSVWSDYIFRGVGTDNAAVQGGLDYSHDSGLYAGIWLSSLASGADAEVDYYGGFASGAFDVGAIYYTVTEDNDGSGDGLWEVYGGVSGESWDAKLWYGLGKEGVEDDEYAYLEGNYTMGNVDLHAGIYTGLGDAVDDSDNDTLDLKAQYNVGDFGIGATWLIKHEANGGSNNNERPTFYVTWGKEFEVK